MRRRRLSCGVVFLLGFLIGCTHGAEKAFDEGVSLWNEGNFREAVQALREVRREYPESPEAPKALFKAGQIQAHDLRQPDQAEETFQLFRLLYPHHVLSERAQEEISTLLFSKKKDYHRAIEASRKLIEHFPASDKVPQMHQRIVRAYLQLREYKAAREEAELFLRKFPGHEYADEVAYQIPQSYFIAGEPEKAAEEARRFISERPASPRLSRVQFLLAAALEDSDRLTEAKAAYEAVRDSHPEPDVVDAKIAAVADRLERKHK